MTSTRESQPSIRVLLISDGSLLSLGVETLLHDTVALKVICDLNTTTVLEGIRAYQPHAVVLGVACEKDETASEWLDILSDVPEIRLVTFSLRDNSVRIYDGGEVQSIPDAHGLLAAFSGPQE